MINIQYKSDIMLYTIVNSKNKDDFIDKTLIKDEIIIK